MPVVSSLINRGDFVYGVAAGPAVLIAKQKGLSAHDAANFSNDALKKELTIIRPDIFLAGTSSGDSIDKKIFGLIPQVPSVYVLDFWSNYRMRFSTDGNDLAYLPNAICVMDELARSEMLDEGFPDDRINVTGNPHIEHFTEGVTTDHENLFEILFISQPVKEIDGSQYGFDEYIVLDHLSHAVKKLPQMYRLSIRLHPKENARKYDKFVDTRVALDDAKTLEESLSKAGLVVGMFSPVLIQAAAAGKKVLSYQPGLTKTDPLITNRIGVTRKTNDENGLEKALDEYVQEVYRTTDINVEKIWPRGATERILQVIDNLL